MSTNISSNIGMHPITIARLIVGKRHYPRSVNLRSNPVRECCLTIKARSPLAPRSKGGTGVFSLVPLRSGDLGGSGLCLKATFIWVSGLS